jgi:hypothetical protein
MMSASRVVLATYVVGAVLGLGHLVVSWVIIADLATNVPDAQWQLTWLVFLPFDLPFSLLVFFSGSLFPDWSVSWLPYPVSEFRSFILPAFVHGILGPAWYFVLPVGIGRWISTRRVVRRSPVSS